MELRLFLAGLALAEAIAFAVQLKDVHVVGEPIEKRAGQAFGAKGFRPFIEGQVAGDPCSAAPPCVREVVRCSTFPLLIRWAG